MSRRKRVRLQFDFTPGEVERLDMLTVRLEAGSRAEAVRRSLRLMDYVTTEAESIFFRRKDGTEFILFVI